jgi:hypothetical protein
VHYAANEVRRLCQPSNNSSRTRHRHASADRYPRIEPPRESRFTLRIYSCLMLVLDLLLGEHVNGPGIIAIRETVFVQRSDRLMRHFVDAKHSNLLGNGTRVAQDIGPLGQVR